MTDLHKQLKQIMAFYLPPGGNVDQAVADVEKAIGDAGYVGPGEMVEYIAEHSVNVHTHHDAFVGPDKIGPVVGIDEIRPPEIEYDKPPKQRFGEPLELMTGSEWLDKTLRAAADHVTHGGEDYIRSNKDFRSRTITIGELEKLLQKAAGVK